MEHTDKTTVVNIPKRIEESLLLRFILIGDRLKKRRDDISKELGISTQQWLLLLQVAKDPNIPFFDATEHEKDLLPTEIAYTFGTTRSNITALINVLSDKGLIALTPDEGDRRRKRIALTAEGSALVEDLQRHRQEKNDALFDGFQQEELVEALDFVERFIVANQIERKSTVSQ